MTIRLVTNEKVAETSSKGNQEKWFDCGRWYKLDQFGYEALAEVVVSTLLEKSNIETDTPFTFTRYCMERLNVHGMDRTGCSSENFLKPEQSIVTISRLLKSAEKRPYMDVLLGLPSDKRRIEYLAKTVAEYTGLQDFPCYLTLLFEVDALFLNDDRHLNNIAVLYKEGSYDYCPIFDNGAGLLSNEQISPMDIEPNALMSVLKARPFQTTFTRQMHTAQNLFGRQLTIPRLNASEIKDVVFPLLEYYPYRDRDIITDRVCKVILVRQKFQ